MKTASCKSTWEKLWKEFDRWHNKATQTCSACKHSRGDVGWERQLPKSQKLVEKHFKLNA